MDTVIVEYNFLANLPLNPREEPSELFLKIFTVSWINKIMSAGN